MTETMQNPGNQLPGSEVFERLEGKLKQLTSKEIFFSSPLFLEYLKRLSELVFDFDKYFPDGVTDTNLETIFKNQSISFYELVDTYLNVHSHSGKKLTHEDFIALQSLYITFLQHKKYEYILRIAELFKDKLRLILNSSPFDSENFRDTLHHIDVFMKNTERLFVDRELENDFEIKLAKDFSISLNLFYNAIFEFVNKYDQYGNNINNELETKVSDEILIYINSIPKKITKFKIFIESLNNNSEEG